MRGVFVSLASLGFVDGQRVFGFSIFADDISATSSETYLLNYEGYPTNTNNTDMLDLVNSAGLYSINQSVLSTNTVLKATLQNRKVLLQWNTISNVETNKVFLQKSSIIFDYNDIAEVGSNQSMYTDEHIISDVAYYRLKLIQQNGSIKFSNIQFVHTKANTTQVFPSVATDVLNFRSNAVSTLFPITISIYNIEGKLVYNSLEKSSSFLKINITSLKNGMHIIKVSQNNKDIISQKFIKN